MLTICRITTVMCEEFVGTSVSLIPTCTKT